MIIGIILAVAVIVIDQVTKFLVDGTPARSIIGNFLWFQSAHNTGVAFSMFEGGLTIFIVISSLASIVLLCLLLSKKYFRTKLKKICLGLVFAGAFSNLIDRIIFGYVRDFIYFKFINYAIFNVADMSVVIGVIIFCILILIDLVKEDRQKKAEAKGTLSVAAESVDGQPSLDQSSETLETTQTQDSCAISAEPDLNEPTQIDDVPSEPDLNEPTQTDVVPSEPDLQEEKKDGGEANDGT